MGKVYLETERIEKDNIEKDNIVLALLEKGYSVVDVVKETKFNNTLVYDIVRKYKLNLSKKAKVSSNKAAVIRELLLKGYNVDAITAEVNCNYQPRLNSDEALRLYNEGLSDSDIALACNCSEITIRRFRSSAGLPINGTYGNPSNEVLLKFYNTGLIDTEIASKCKCTLNKVSSWRIANGLPPNRKSRLSFEDWGLK